MQKPAAVCAAVLLPCACCTAELGWSCSERHVCRLQQRVYLLGAASCLAAPCIGGLVLGVLALRLGVQHEYHTCACCACAVAALDVLFVVMLLKVGSSESPQRVV